MADRLKHINTQSQIAMMLSNLMLRDRILCQVFRKNGCSQRLYQKVSTQQVVHLLSQKDL